MELDSFCERETNPPDADISNVGMTSLLTSKLYGNRNAAATNASCSGGGALTPTGCSNSGGTNPCTGCATGTFTPYSPSGNGPGKANFLGFGALTTGVQACPNITAISPGSHYLQDVTATIDGECVLGVDNYKMGVFGHVGGTDYYSLSIVDTGVIIENEGAPTQSWLAVGDFDHTCT